MENLLAVCLLASIILNIVFIRSYRSSIRLLEYLVKTIQSYMEISREQDRQNHKLMKNLVDTFHKVRR